jgi:hypothetical protein
VPARQPACRQVAEWAGNSVDVLLLVYAKWIHGRDEIKRKLIADTLRDDEDAEVCRVRLPVVQVMNSVMIGQ